MLGEMYPAKALLAAYPAIHKTPGPHGISLLSHTIAGKKQSWDAFLLLLNAGADVNAAAWRGTTPLIHAVAMSEADMVRALLDRGADPSIKTPAGKTALDFARERKDAAIVEILSESVDSLQPKEALADPLYCPLGTGCKRIRSRVGLCLTEGRSTGRFSSA